MDAVLLVEVAVVVAILAMLWVLPDWPAYRKRLAPTAPPVPPGPPIERIAADARRIRAELRRAPADLPVARRRGWLEAYDDVLVMACRSLDLAQRLDVLPEGSTHDLERERVERLLEATGLLRRTA